MGKLIFFLLVALGVWWLVRGLTRDKIRHDDPAAPASSRVEDMVVCSRCGVNMPRSSAREEGGRFFCLENPNCRP